MNIIFYQMMKENIGFMGAIITQINGQSKQCLFPNIIVTFI